MAKGSFASSLNKLTATKAAVAASARTTSMIATLLSDMGAHYTRASAEARYNSWGVDLTTQVRRENGFAIVELKGEVDVFTSPQLREKLLELLGSGRRDLIVDLNGLEFCDSNGLDVLIGAVRRVNDLGGSLGIVCSQEKIMKLLRSTGLTKVLAVYPSVKAAAAEMTPPETSREPTRR